MLVKPPAPEHVGARFEQSRIGLHHPCFRARERGDIDEAFAFLTSIGARIVHGPQDDAFAPASLGWPALTRTG